MSTGSVTTSAMTVEAMMANRDSSFNRRSPFASSLESANIDSYMKSNLVQLENSGSNNARSMENKGDNWVPSFEGFLSFGFSMHTPCDHTMEDCAISIDGSQQGRLESLVMLFLCSQGVEMVISTTPSTLLHVCPFNKNNPSSSSTAALTKSSENALLGNKDDPNAEPIILWNLPKFEATEIGFDNPNAESKVVLDMATNQNTTFIMSNQPQQYYTMVNFTFPVYQWGSEDPSVEQALQDEFDNGVIRTGTLESLLPWPNAVASPLGDEPYVFWDEPLPPAIGFFDTTIPENIVSLMQVLGGGLIVFNTLVIVLLSLLARIRKRKTERKIRNARMNGGERSPLEADYLDTEAGVSAILMESKHYALAKGLTKNSEAFRQQYALNSNVLGADRNIQGVEVDLKMVDHSHYHQHQMQQQQHHYDHKRSPQRLERKEDMLLARAKGSSANNTNNTQWFSGKKLLSYNDDDDDYEDEDKTDLQILDLVPPVTSLTTTKSSC